VLLFCRELGQDQQKVPWLNGAESMKDFRQALLQTKNKYHAAPYSKAHKWLGVLARRCSGARGADLSTSDDEYEGSGGEYVYEGEAS
jgi:hypothetical protein